MKKIDSHFFTNPHHEKKVQLDLKMSGRLMHPNIHRAWNITTDTLERHSLDTYEMPGI